MIDETASNENELIQLLKKLSEAFLSYKKKTTLFASRQGKLLRGGKTSSFTTNVQACSRCVGTQLSRSVNFLLSLYQLFEEYPRLCYCAVPIRSFMSNIKIILEICEEDAISFGRTFLS